MDVFVESVIMESLIVESVIRNLCLMTTFSIVPHRERFEHSTHKFLGLRLDLTSTIFVLCWIQGYSQCHMLYTVTFTLGSEVRPYFN